MSKLSILCIILGIIAIGTRGPLLIAPDAFMGLLTKLTSSNRRIRLLGTGIMVLGMAMILTAWGSLLTETSAVGGSIFLIWGGVIVLLSLFFLLLFPDTYRSIIEILNEVDTSVLRFFGIIGILIGAALIYLGVAVFS